MGKRKIGCTMLRRGSTRRKKTPYGNTSTEGLALNSIPHCPSSPILTVGSDALVGCVVAEDGADAGTIAFNAARMLTGSGAIVVSSVNVPMMPLVAIRWAGTAMLAVVFAPCAVSVMPASGSGKLAGMSSWKCPSSLVMNVTGGAALPTEPGSNSTWTSAALPPSGCCSVPKSVVGRVFTFNAAVICTRFCWICCMPRYTRVMACVRSGSRSLAMAAPCSPNGSIVTGMRWRVIGAAVMTADFATALCPLGTRVALLLAMRASASGTNATSLGEAGRRGRVASRPALACRRACARCGRPDSGASCQIA